MNLAPTNHLRRGRTHSFGGADFFDHAIFKHGFHSVVNSGVKLIAVAKHEDTAGRIGYSPLPALVRGSLPCRDTNLQRAHETTAIFWINLARGFGIKLHKLRA